MDFPSVRPLDGRQDRQEKLNQALDLLSTRQIDERDDCCKAALFFLALYEDGAFRHMYSQVYSAMSAEGDLDRELESCTCLSDNLGQIVFPRCADDCTVCPALVLREERQFLKLYDHVELEARRVSNERNMTLGLLSAMKQGKKALEKASGESNQARSRLRKASRKIDTLQKETVAILGIFAAIVLAFNGAIGLSVSAVEAAGSQGGMQNLFLMVILGGFILVNGIAILLAFVWQIVRGVQWDDEAGGTRGKHGSRRPGPKVLLGLAVVLVDIVLVVAALYVAAGRVPPLPLP